MTAIQQRPGTYNTAAEAIATLLAITTGLLLGRYARRTGKTWDCTKPDKNLAVQQNAGSVAGISLGFKFERSRKRLTGSAEYT
jgi:hypothetical protein